MLKEDVKKVITDDIKAIVKSLGSRALLLNGKTVLITGGSGFLGAYMVATLALLNEHVLDKPCKIIVLDNYITGVKKNVISEQFDLQDVKFIKYDVRKPLRKIIHIDYIIHAAGIASPAYYRKYPIETLEVAVFGTRNLLEFARKNKVKGFLFFSSSEIYGDPSPEHIPTPETYWGHVSSLGPRSCYDESKRLGETLCMLYCQIHDVPVKIVRPFNVYGPGMKRDDYRVIPAFMTQGLRGEPLTVHEKGNQTRTFSYIADATAGFLKVLLSKYKGEVFNIGDDREELNVAALADIINGILPKKVEVRYIHYPESYPAGEPQRRCPDISKAKRNLKYSCKTDLHSGLRRTMAWYIGMLKM